MDFNEKISIILKTNTLQLVTKEDLAEYCGFHRDTIRKAIDRKTELKDRYLRIFQDKLGINPDWWDTGKGDIYLSKHTQETKAGDSKEISSPDPDEVMRQIISGKGAYILINRDLILEKYRLVSVEQYEEEKMENKRKYEEALRKHEVTKKELESRKNEIDGLYKLMSEILKKIPDSSGQVPALQGQQ